MKLDFLKKKDKEPKVEFTKKWEPFVFLLPFAIGVTIFTIYPLFNVIFMAFKENFVLLTGKYSSIGFANFKYVVQDRYFIQGMQNTFKYVLIVIPISTCISIVIATLLNNKIKFMPFFQTAYFLPMVTSATAVGLAWKYMFHYRYGVVNYLLNLVGINPIAWLTDVTSNLTALCVYGVWNMLPFTIILLLSGLQNIDKLYYTAARVDGASTLRIFFRITVPMLLPTIFLTMVVNSISAFKVFHELFPLWSGQPGIAYNLFTVVYYIFYQFRGLTPPQYGRAAAAAVILFSVIFIFTRIQIWIQKKFSN